MPQRVNLLTQKFVYSLADYAIIIMDRDGYIMSWNAGAGQLKGYSAAEIIGKHFSIFYTPEARSVGHPQRELIAAVTTGKFEEQGWRVRKDGSRFWANVVINPILDNRSEICAFGKITRDMTAAKQSAEQMANIAALLESTARTDFLTGLDNRRSLDTLLAAAIAAAKRHDRPMVVAMLDLDHFKHYNDTYGHQNGDRFLRNAASTWRRVLRAEDILARYGGEEFTVAMPETNITDAVMVLERLRQATPSPLTVSIGAAQWDGAENAASLIGRADRALYRAKNAGRNRTETNIQGAPNLHLISTTSPTPTPKPKRLPTKKSKAS